MQTWANYSLSDLLMFSPATYFRLYELNNAALWPLHLLMIAVALALLALTRRTETGSGKIIALLLAPLWGVVAWWFFYRHYGKINMAAPWFSVAFGIEALLLFVVGITGKNGFGRPAWHSVPMFNPGLILFLYALVLHPIIGLLSGRSWNGIELFGLAPDPTALGTLGILLMGSGVIPRLLALIPLIWCLISGLTYLAMEIPHGLVTPAAAVIAMVATTLFHRIKHWHFHLS